MALIARGYARRTRARPSYRSVIAAVTIALVAGAAHARTPAIRDAATVLPGAAGVEGACALWFIGSSSIYRWATLNADLSPWIVRNRGIAGATIPDLLARFVNDGDVGRPQAIIFYAGENDLVDGVSAAQDIADLRRFLDAKRKRFGRLPMFVISIKPSPTRWRFHDAQAAFNAAARALAQRRRDVTFVDVAPAFLHDGRLGAYYVADGIHLNPAGYAIWTHAVRQALVATLPPRTLRRCAAG